VYVVGSAPRGKDVVEKVIGVVPHEAVGTEECPYMLPRAFDGYFNT
jgi:hypothetical protein